jgi:DUF1365 family protein
VTASALYHGRVRHRRFTPRAHAFSYRVFMLYLDLSELEHVFRGRWFWSTKRRNLVRFDRRDHLGPPHLSLDAAVRRLVATETGQCPAGPIRLLTQPRFFGFCFNPVSFYYCFDGADAHVETIVAEVHNTPWGERHCYVLPTEGAARRHRFRFRKAFHVSPFLAMDYAYDWRLTEPGERLAVHMRNERDGACDFDASMALERRPLTGAAMAAALARHPFMTGKVIAAIYWQALRLWVKGTPLHAHPRSGKGAA